ncbi:relaxase/mobilization nuclease domain-containing protein [Spirosoma jeollabukense]
MVIRLTVGAQIGGALRYNEQKVVQKQAHVLSAAGFANNELAEKSRRYATNVLESQAQKNANVKKPTLHFSLSLHPTEQVSDDKFKAMAHQFMAEMGYRHQPYMVYRHHDTAHPHIHIVTTCVDETGYKINDSFIKRRTNAVRQQLELRFGLIKAQGRGKGKTTEQIQQAIPVQADAVMPGQAQPTRGFDRKDQLEAILRETFQQAAFNNLDEYRALLKKQHIHTVLHQSTRAGKAFRGISYQFTDEAGKPATPRIKASEIGTWATWKEIEKQFGKRGQQQGQGPSTELTYEKYNVLASILSDEVRAYKKQQHIYYDSALLENFPTAAMQARLQAITQHKLSEGELNEAVRRFEAYKRAQLPDIIKKEQLAFRRTMETYTQIASEIRGSAQNKNDFFSALSVEITVDGWITSPTNRHVAYQIGRAALARIQAGDGPELTMPTLYSRGERTVMLLSGSKKPFKESYYDVRADHLKRILKPERMSSIHAQLNANYVARLQADGPVLAVDQVRYFYQRGIVLDPQRLATGKAENESAFTIRYHRAPLQAAVPAGKMFEKQMPYLNIVHWQKGLSTEAGRYMVALAQLIDQAKRDQAENSNEKSNDLAFFRERIHHRDPALVMFSDEDLVSVLEKRSLQGKGLIKQTDLESKQDTNAYMNESTLHTSLLNIRAADVFGYEQTGKYKNVGKGIKKRDKGREL